MPAESSPSPAPRRAGRPRGCRGSALPCVWSRQEERTQGRAAEEGHFDVVREATKAEEPAPALDAIEGARSARRGGARRRASSPAWRRCRPARGRRPPPSRSGGCRLRGGPAPWVWPRRASPYFEDFDLPDLLRATACRTRAVNADSSTSSPSWMSIARRTLPSRLELKRRRGSFRDAPLAKVSFTTLL